MKHLKAWLVISYSGEMRVVKTTPSLKPNEVAYALNVAIPDRHPPKFGEISLELPEYTAIPLGAIDINATSTGWEGDEQDETRTGQEATSKEGRGIDA